MQMRSNKSCKLTAGGIYEMNIENFKKETLINKNKRKF